MANKYFYTLNRFDASLPDHERLTIEVYEDTDNRFKDVLTSFTWLSEPNKPSHENSGWYGFNVKVDTRYLDDFNKAATQIRRILGKISTTPKAIIEQLETFRNYQYKVYDKRLGDYTPVNDVPGDAWSRWTDKSGYGRAWAVDEDDAKSAVFNAFSESIAKNSYSGAKSAFETWILNGKQVQLKNGRYAASVPDTTHPLRLVRLPFEQCHICGLDIEEERLNVYRENRPTTCTRCESNKDKAVDHALAITEDFFADAN